MNKGLIMMLKSFGLEPEKVQQFAAWAETNLPKAIEQFNEMIARQKRIEEKLDKVLGIVHVPLPKGLNPATMETKEE